MYENAMYQQNETRTYQTKTLSYPKFLQDTIDRIGTVSYKQFELLCKIFINQGFPHFSYKQEVMDKAVSVFISKGRNFIKKDLISNGEDYVFHHSVKENINYDAIPCLWALLNYFNPEKVCIPRIMKARTPASIEYFSDDGSDFRFYYIDEKSISLMPKTIDELANRNKKSNEERQIEEERGKTALFRTVNVYVTSSVSIAKEIETFDIPCEYIVSVLQTPDGLPYDKPAKIVYVKDGKKTIKNTI